MDQLLQLLIHLSELENAVRRRKELQYLSKVSDEQRELLQEILDLIDKKELKAVLLKIDQIQKIKEIKFIYRFQGRIHQHFKNIELAIQSYQNMLKVKPNSKSAFYNLADIYEELEQFDKEIEMLEKGVAIKANSARLYRLGVLCQKKNDHFKCIQHISKAIDLNPKCKFYFLKIISCIHVKDFKVALECCDIALAIKPNKAKLHYLKSVTLDCLNRKEEAQKHAKIASEGNRFYDLQDYRQKQEMSQMKSQLQKKQSQIKVRPSQIKTAKYMENTNNFKDAYLYTFTSYLYIQSNEGKEDYSENLALIQPFLKVQNVKVVPDFESLITECLLKCFPKIKNQIIIRTELSKWFNEKIKHQIKSKSFQEDFATIIVDLLQTAEATIQDMLNESSVKKVERQNKYPEFMNFLNAINEAFQEYDQNIYKSSGGKYGLERAIKLIGFLVSFPELIEDKDRYDDQIYCIASQQDDEENFRGSQILIQQKKENPKGDEVRQSMIKFLPQNMSS